MSSNVDDHVNSSKIELTRHRLAVAQDDDGEAVKPELSVCQTGKIAGRGVFAVKALLAGTLINVSHTLLFPAKEYQTFGKFTQLDNYTFVWEKTKEGNIMALALGLGSLFNHSYKSPNVSYSFDRTNQTIRYTLMRNVNPGEELCISYGSGRMWWESAEDGEQQREDANEDNWLTQFTKLDVDE